MLNIRFPNLALKVKNANGHTVTICKRERAHARWGALSYNEDVVAIIKKTVRASDVGPGVV